VVSGRRRDPVPAGSGDLRQGPWVPGGFTMLEVMVAIAYVAFFFTAFYASQAQSISMCSEARWETVAPLMARCKLSEIELYLMEEGFSEVNESESGRECCEISENEDFTCDWDIVKVELPGIADLANAQSTAIGKDGLSSLIGDFQAERVDSQLQKVGGMGALAMLVPMINELFTAAIRRVDLVVRWDPVGQPEQTLSISYYVVNHGEGSLGPLIQMGVIQDLAGGVVPQQSLDFDEMQPVIKQQLGGGVLP